MHHDWRTDAHQQLVTNLYQGILLRQPEPEILGYWCGRLAEGADPNEIVERLLNSEEFERRKSARLFVPPGHFYSPIVDIDQVRPLFNRPEMPNRLPGISLDPLAMAELWQQFLPFLKDIPFPEDPAQGFRYSFRNPAFSYGDGSILYAMLRHFRPRRLVEVGSGHSSACAMDTIDHHLDGNVQVTFIEPHPELLLEVLGKETANRVTIHAACVQDIDLATFTDLEAGDFLFIDSTHVLKTGSDVCHELFNVLPALKPGVFIHFHDIFWPFEYGADWVLRENRSWNEIYALRAFLMYNDAFEIVFFNDYFAKTCCDTIQADYPAMLKNGGGSLWLRKKDTSPAPRIHRGAASSVPACYHSA
jgi:hypothetical protein